MVPRRRNRSIPPPPDCPLAECMKLLQGTWTVQIIWYLRGGARRFSELRYDMPGLSAKTLTARLRRLEGDGILTRRVMATSPPTVDYELTALGQRLIPAIDAIVEVGRSLKSSRPAPRPAGSTAAPHATK